MYTPLSAGWVGVSLLPNFQKWGSLTGSQFLEGVAGKEGVNFLRGCSFNIKNKLKSEIFNDRNLATGLQLEIFGF